MSGQSFCRLSVLPYQWFRWSWYSSSVNLDYDLCGRSFWSIPLHSLVIFLSKRRGKVAVESICNSDHGCTPPFIACCRRFVHGGFKLWHPQSHGHCTRATIHSLANPSADPTSHTPTQFTPYSSSRAEVVSFFPTYIIWSVVGEFIYFICLFCIRIRLGKVLQMGKL